MFERTEDTTQVGQRTTFGSAISDFTRPRQRLLIWFQRLVKLTSIAHHTPHLAEDLIFQGEVTQFLREGQRFLIFTLQAIDITDGER